MTGLIAEVLLTLFHHFKHCIACEIKLKWPLRDSVIQQEHVFSCAINFYDVSGAIISLDMVCSDPCYTALYGTVISPPL